MTDQGGRSTATAKTATPRRLRHNGRARTIRSSWPGWEGEHEASASKPASEVLLYQDAVRKYPELAE